MGKSQSKLKQYLKNGDENGVINYFYKNRHKHFDPNLSYGEKYSHNTPLHLAAKRSMPKALALFLDNHGGNPYKANSLNQTALHLVCKATPYDSPDLAMKESKNCEICLLKVLEWKEFEDSLELSEISRQDNSGNTPLHYAAQSGLLTCVKLLVEKGAELFIENRTSETACELAEKANRTEVAQFLETKMVFTSSEPEEIERPLSPSHLELSQSRHGLKPQDLMNAKDTLVVETADMLRIPLFTAEALLRSHEWSREQLLEAWIENPIACCEKSGVVPPDNLDAPEREHELNQAAGSSAQLPEYMCEICYIDNISPEDRVSIVFKCEHTFCQQCWKGYLHLKIQDGDAHNIVCPAFACHKLVPVEFIEKIVSPSMARRYLQFDIKAFVETNPQMIWCPHPGCGLVLQCEPRRASVASRSSLPHLSETGEQRLPTTAVCSNGHSFCWGCQLEPHEPATCEHYKLWMEKIAQVAKEKVDNINQKSETAANIFWMTRNSKKCPACKSPIEKNEGCNHMRCSKCKHDFCWVCLEPWKKHNSSTGGFFRCTRYEVLEQVDTKYKTELSDAMEKHHQLQKLNRFVHYYTRFENHKHSYELEEPLLERAKLKIKQLHPTDSSGAKPGKFLEDAISSLLKSRHILQYSYVFGFYLKETGVKRQVFELLQTELEEQVEVLSEIISRPYLRTPKSQIQSRSKAVLEKREELLSSISQGLVPPGIPSQGTSASANWSDFNQWNSEADLTAELTTFPNQCKTDGCTRSRLGHSGLPDQRLDYCSAECLKKDYLNQMRHKEEKDSMTESMKMLRLLSRSMRRELRTNQSSSTSDESLDDTTPQGDPVLQRILRLSENVYEEELDEDLTLALKMSLHPLHVQEDMLRQHSETRRQRALSQSDATALVNDELQNLNHPGLSIDGASTSRAGAITPAEVHSNPVASSSTGATSVDPNEIYQARLDELDRVIEQLLNEGSSLTSSPRSRRSGLRRTESDRRASSRAENSVRVRRAGSVNYRNLDQSVPRTRSANQRSDSQRSNRERISRSPRTRLTSSREINRRDSLQVIDRINGSGDGLRTMSNSEDAERRSGAYEGYP